MPAESAHVHLVLHDLEVLTGLSERPGHHDWVAVVAFYAALHAVEALFAREKPQGQPHGHDHENRERLLKSDNRYNAAYTHYRPLQGIATVARYLESRPVSGLKQPPKGLRTFAEYMDEAAVISEVIRHRLNQVLSSVGGLLAGKGSEYGPLLKTKAEEMASFVRPVQGGAA